MAVAAALENRGETEGVGMEPRLQSRSALFYLLKCLGPLL